jgi:putative phosphonate metabolism protein
MLEPLAKPANPRFAVFYAPPERTVLAQAGASWLGRDVVSGEARAQPCFAEISPARLAELTSSARRYGLHGTLKPPFALNVGRTLADLDAAVAALAARQTAFSFGVRIAPLAGFLAWQPVSGQAQIEIVAANCVTELDDFRLPADAAELARRRAAGLSARQDELLLRWGYPYVLEAFRFHITLTDRVVGEVAHQIQAILEQGGAGQALTPLQFDSLCLFMEPAPGADLRLIARYGFDGQVQRYSGWPK